MLPSKVHKKSEKKSRFVDTPMVWYDLDYESSQPVGVHSIAWIVVAAQFSKREIMHSLERIFEPIR